MRHRHEALLLAALLLTAGPARAAWQDDLAVEIRAAEACTVAYLSQVVERMVDGRQVVLAKAHCEDGRVFDATRTSATAPFEFKACQPAGRPQAC